MKMFKVCRTCMNNLQYTAMNRFKLPKNDSIAICPMKPTCHGQPERSKREDCEKCTILKRGDTNDINSCCYMEISQMRCSEHCGNTVRDK